MIKKISLLTFAFAIAVATVPMFAAYEAHVINVTAHIENALVTHNGPVKFGTVFPQEYIEKPISVTLSTSFTNQDRIKTVDYKIVQKPKCECLGAFEVSAECPSGQYAPVGYATHACPSNYEEMLSLCPFLSKIPRDEAGDDTGVSSYFVPADEAGNEAFCETRTGEEVAFGVLTTETNEIDEWIIDLKVPPVDGFVGQEWPASCPTVPVDSEDYGCDLWIEVTGFDVPLPGSTE